MEFESPDVEKDFPGLYSESAKKNNDSDFSDESHEKSFKSDLIGKRKDKKDSKKDRGYAALEGESSPDEGDAKSPSKSKKTKSFKFPVKKSEKREKSRDKDVKEKEVDKEKKKEKDKREKSKQKERKKGKQGEEVSDSVLAEEHAIFGVPLSLAVERLGCLDGIGIPLPVRHSIECIHASGLTTESLYKTEKVAGIKTKLQSLKKKYNARENISTSDWDLSLATSVFITFLKELPEPILTNDLLARFEEAGAIQDVAQREDELNKLVLQLPNCNSTLLAWIILHFDHVTRHEKQNKINAQSIAMTFSPVLQMSHRLLTALLCHCKALFPHTDIIKYVPPLVPGSRFPEDPHALSIELKKQEALLSQIHQEMNEGFVSKKREELLWEVQRIVTQLKRKLRTIQKAQGGSLAQKSLDEEQPTTEDTRRKNEEKPPKEEPVISSTVPSNTAQVDTAPEIPKVANPPEKDSTSLEVTPKEEVQVDAPSTLPSEEPAVLSPSKTSPEQSEGNVDTASPMDESDQETPVASPIELSCENPLYDTVISSPWEEEAKLQLEHVELLKLQAKLQERLKHERWQTEKLRVLIDSYRGIVDSASEDSSANSSPTCRSPETEARIQELLDENQKLVQKKDELVKRILEERQACIKLNVSINYLKLEQMYKAA